MQHLPPDIAAELRQFRERYMALNQQIVDSVSEVLADQQHWCTDNVVVLESGVIRLRKFQGGSNRFPPLLIVYSHVNRPNVIDMHPDHSLIRRLTECGLQVYLLDWSVISAQDRQNDLSVYIDQGIDTATRFLIDAHGYDRVNLLGICQGGTFALCHACLYPQHVNKFCSVVTPVDFSVGNSLLRHWVKYIDFTLLEQQPVNIPGQLITLMFQMLRPFGDLQRHVQLIKAGGEVANPELVTRMDQWAYHCPDQAGRAFAQFIRLFFQENALVHNRLVIAGKAVSLSQLTMPVLNVYAEHDHLVPAQSASALGQFVDPEHYQERRFAGGHIGLMVSKRAQHTVLPDIGNWFTAEP